jgi:hypothetical protein
MALHPSGMTKSRRGGIGPTRRISTGSMARPTIGIDARGQSPAYAPGFFMRGTVVRGEGDGRRKEAGPLR